MFIVSEDNGPEIGCYGTPIDTPHLDKLAAGGTLFRNAYVPQAGCSQSRAAFLTGLYPHQNGQIGLATWKYSMYSDKIPNLVKTLGKAGYRTGIIGKLHVNPQSAFPFHFKAIPDSNFNRKNMAAYSANAKRFFRESDKPFYLQVNYPDARPFIRRVDDLPARPLTGKDVDAIAYMGINHPELRQQTADYYNCMMRLDSHIGELLKALD
ncbi:MAG: sulfatase-like hydrolase/transferase, partial [Pirellulales bacterium]